MNYSSRILRITNHNTRARWFTLQFFAHRTEFLVVHDSPLTPLGIPFPDNGRNDHDADPDNDEEEEEEEEEGFYVRNDAGEVHYKSMRVRLSLFRRALLYESIHCKGPWTMVATMRSECQISPPSDVFGLYPQPRAQAWRDSSDGPLL